MSKRPQSGDIDIDLDRKICIESVLQEAFVQFLDAQGGRRYRNWLNGRKVATSTSTLNPKNA